MRSKNVEDKRIVIEVTGILDIDVSKYLVNLIWDHLKMLWSLKKEYVCLLDVTEIWIVLMLHKKIQALFTNQKVANVEDQDILVEYVFTKEVKFKN